ncbi:MAG: 3-deoxy-manno-octulosonate-8-phosphatase KdsC [Gammaproteobacteria bacterium]|nr:3-deoxy-manno-octulosonate-8-phosphatase KdsC [Gammaproteobacteria bacterium]
MTEKLKREIFEKAAQIRLLVFDVDGVLTDGSLFIGEDGREYKAFHARDGLGIKLLQATGIEIGIITGMTSGAVEHRMAALGIKHVFQGKLAKQAAFKELCQCLNLEPRQAAFVGDDVIDLPALMQAGLRIAVADAHPLVLRHADWHTQHLGGHGAARDVCELIMQAQGTWREQLRQFGVEP